MIVPARVLRCSDAHGVSEADDVLAPEEPLEIRVGGKPVSVVMRTPGQDLELAAGFLLTEGVVESGCVPFLRHVHPNRVNAAIPAASGAAVERARRRVFTASSCGLCGKGTIESIYQRFGEIDDEVRLSPEVLPRMLDALRGAQPEFTRTGGVHAAAVFHTDGNLVVAREDIGRHNAVDKAIGHCLLRRTLPLSGHVLLVSGRASFEIMQKALAARIPIVAAVSAPSSLAVSFARECGQTLVAFLRPGKFNIYAHPERLVKENCEDGAR
jgi:FdhD protein